MKVPIIMLSILLGFAVLGIGTVHGAATAGLTVLLAAALVAIICISWTLLKRLLPIGSPNKPTLPIHVLECKHANTHRLDFGSGYYDTICNDCGEVVASYGYAASDS